MNQLMMFDVHVYSILIWKEILPTALLNANPLVLLCEQLNKPSCTMQFVTEYNFLLHVSFQIFDFLLPQSEGFGLDVTDTLLGETRELYAYF